MSLQSCLPVYHLTFVFFEQFLMLAHINQSSQCYVNICLLFNKQHYLTFQRCTPKFLQFITLVLQQIGSLRIFYINFSVKDGKDAEQQNLTTIKSILDVVFKISGYFLSLFCSCCAKNKNICLFSSILLHSL